MAITVSNILSKCVIVNFTDTSCNMIVALEKVRFLGRTFRTHATDLFLDVSQDDFLPLALL
jgi:hypothetical protein